MKSVDDTPPLEMLATLGDPLDREQPYRQLLRFAKDLKIALDRERQRARELESAYFETVVRLMAAASLRDPELGDHIGRLGRYVECLARELSLPAPLVSRLAAASALHDVGKIGIDDRVLRKTGRFTNDERLVMNQHAEIGARLLDGSSSELIQLAQEIALTHHESWDGSGYPRGLRGEAIPLSGRVVKLADAYDALRSPRRYKPAYDHDEAVEIILRGDSRTRPEHFDPQLLALFVRIHGEFARIWEESQVSPAFPPDAPGAR